MYANTYALDSKPQWTPKPISEAQRNFIASLIKDKGITAEKLLEVFPQRPATSKEASKVIDWLKAQPSKTAATQATPAPSSPQNWDDITDGNYALPYKGKTHFYRVSRKEGKGKWAGRIFVNVQERASDELYMMEKRAQFAVLHSIRDYGVKESHELFAEVMEQCWHCTKSIGDETNPYKPFGLGPVCGPKVMG